MACGSAQIPAVSSKFKVSRGNPRRCHDTNYIDVCIPQGVEKKTTSALKNLQLNGENVLVQLWAAKRIGKSTVVLTTTRQPFGLRGNNSELRPYHKACLQHKLYVHDDVDPKKIAAFGLPGRVFFTCKPEQTQDMHRYPKDHRPPGRDAIFSRKWGSFAVPVIVDNQCVYVIEFVMDTPKDSYDGDIYVVCKALENVGLQTSIQIEHLLQNANLQTSIQIEQPVTTFINGQERFRRTLSLPCVKYCRLVPYFGLSSRVVADKLELTTSTFRNVCRAVGIHEWPYIPNETRKASSFSGTRFSNQTASSETSSFGTSDASEDTFSSPFDLIDNGNGDIPELSPEHQGKLADLMQEYKDLIDHGNEAPEMEDIHMADTLFDYNKFEKDQEQRFEPIPC